MATHLVDQDDTNVLAVCVFPERRLHHRERCKHEQGRDRDRDRDRGRDRKRDRKRMR